LPSLGREPVVSSGFICPWDVQQAILLLGIWVALFALVSACQFHGIICLHFTLSVEVLFPHKQMHKSSRLYTTCCSISDTLLRYISALHFHFICSGCMGELSRIVDVHYGSTSHNLFIRLGDSSRVELYCAQCKDFQYSPLFDRLVLKKRSLTTDESPQVDTSSNLDCHPISTDLSLSDSSKRHLRNRRKVSRGICNMGSTCFLSAVLQVLLHCNVINGNLQLSQKFLNDHPCRDGKLVAQSAVGCIVCELRNVFHENISDGMFVLVFKQILFSILLCLYCWLYVIAIDKPSCRLIFCTLFGTMPIISQTTISKMLMSSWLH